VYADVLFVKRKNLLLGYFVQKRRFLPLSCFGKFHCSHYSDYSAAITLFLVLTAGSAIAFGVFRLFQQQADYTIFTYPLIHVMTVSFALLAVCIITPESVYRSIHKSTIVERLREAE
jgi:hypothetical protein